jgi:hypothetical protein
VGELTLDARPGWSGVIDQFAQKGKGDSANMIKVEESESFSCSNIVPIPFSHENDRIALKNVAGGTVAAIPPSSRAFFRDILIAPKNKPRIYP